MMPSMSFARTLARASNIQRRASSMSSRNSSEISSLLRELRALDTACLCDADKTLVSSSSSPDYQRLKLLDARIRALNNCNFTTMAGIARTVQLTEPNDFLAVLRGLYEAEENEVLVVNTLSSHRAVAGELFCGEAQRKGLAGIVIDGPMRDTRCLQDFSVRCYASAVSPYSGTIQHCGTMQEPIVCGGIEVSPGEIVVGDDDGILVGSIDSFQTILPISKAIQQTEMKLRDAIQKGTDLCSMTNYVEHLEKRQTGKESALEFRLK